MSAAIRCRHLHRQRGLPRLQGGSGAGRDSACCAGRLRPPPPWDRSDSAAAVLRGRRPRARWARSAAFPSGSAKARIWRILASILRMSWHQLKACVPSTAHITQFVHGIRILAICSCGGILQICQWYRVCDAGALRAEPLATLYILRGDAVPLPNLQYTPTRTNSKIRIPCTNHVDGPVQAFSWCQDIRKIEPRTSAKSVLSEQLRESR